METTKTLNREKTIQNIMEMYENGEVSINIDKFNERIKEKNSDQFLIEAAELCGAKISYQ